MPTKEQKIAIHESGHAVIARVLNIGLRHVTMFSTGDGNAAGALTESAAGTADKSDHSAQIRGCENDARVALAGPHAQHQYAQRKYKFAKRTEWRSDFDLAKNCVLKALLLKDDPEFRLSDEGRQVKVTHEQMARAQLQLDQFSVETAELVSDYWEAIQKTADELMQRRILSESDIDAILRIAKNNPEARA